MWREEFCGGIIEECRARGPDSHCIRGEVDLPCTNTCFELRCSIASVAKGFQRESQVGHEEKYYTRIAEERLSETKVTGHGAVSVRLQLIDRVLVMVVEVGSRWEPLDVVGYEVEVNQCLVVWKEIQKGVGRGSADDRGEIIEGDGLTSEFSSGASEKNHFV